LLLGQKERKREREEREREKEREVGDIEREKGRRRKKLKKTKDKDKEIIKIILRQILILMQLSECFKIIFQNLSKVKCMKRLMKITL
jgi:hypothetical protein